MDIPEGEEEVFEIVDFTSASDWELFTTKLEEIILLWHLSSTGNEDTVLKKDFHGSWSKESQDINFSGYPFIVTRHWLNSGKTNKVTENHETSTGVTSSVFASLRDSSRDFKMDENHFLGTCYGLDDFLVISPAGNEALSTESRVALVVSSITMAINNTHCKVPVFVQVHAKAQKYFLGVHEARGLRTEFDMVHLKRAPPTCTHLSGALSVFKSKIGNHLSADQTSVSIRWTYVLQDANEDWPQSPPDFGNDLDLLNVKKLPFGAAVDPIKEMQLAAIWPSLNESSIVDSESYTDLDPKRAPLWSINVTLDDTVAALLTSSLTSFIFACKSPETMERLLGKNYTVLQSPDSPAYAAALGPLTNPGLYRTGSAVPQWGAKPSSNNGGPIAEKTLIALLNYLFPDAEGEESKHKYPENLEDEADVNVNKSLKDALAGFKSCPVDSLPWRLALCFLYVNVHLSGLDAVAHLWHEVVLELRYRWDHGHVIPGLERGAPNLSYCRLYQKLQMLNCCTDAKKSREEKQAEPGDDDEFFDAVEDVSMEESDGYSMWNKPQGRKEATKMRLIKTGDTLYVPVTQDLLPMTEDMLEEQAEMLVQLGTDSEGSELRARLMSASLLSDMEAFKAANPGAVLEDFVRWYSPRDWIEDELATAEGQGRSVQGHLSSRMQIPGNLWQEVWESARPVVAWRQKRLFNDTKEAEKILHDFSAARPGLICSMLLPVVQHAAIHRLIEERVAGIAEVDAKLEKIVLKGSQNTRDYPPDIDAYESVFSLMRDCELRLSQYEALLRKCSDENQDSGMDVVKDLVSSRKVSLEGGATSAPGLKILPLFTSKSKDLNSEDRHFPSPWKKEYILRAVASRPGKSSTASLQRMYCSVQKDDFRLAGAFTQDTVFY